MNRVEPNRNVYIGHRYVPLLVGEWDKSIQYEGLSIVTFKGASYTSKKMTPPGIDIKNEEFWVLTGNYDAQVEYYRKETERVANDLAQAKIDLNKRIDDTVEYVNTNVEDLTIYVNDEVRKNKDYVDGEVLRLTGYVDDEVSKNKDYVDDEVRKNKAYVDSEVTELTGFVNNRVDATDENLENLTTSLNRKFFPTDAIDHVPTAKDVFMETMNDYADKFEMYDTSFVNPHGLRQTGQQITARDALLLGLQAMAYPTLSKAMGTVSRSIRIKGDNARTMNINHSIPSRLFTTESLFGKNYKIIGVKSGTLIDKGGVENVVMMASSLYDGGDFISAVIDSPGDRYMDAMDGYNIANSTLKSRRKFNGLVTPYNNGHFLNGLNGYAVYDGNPTVDYNDYLTWPASLNVNSNGNRNNVRFLIDNFGEPGDIMYAYAYVKITDYIGGGVGFQIESDEYTSHTVQRVTNEWVKVSARFTFTSNTKRIYAGSIGDSDLKGNLDCINLVNLTQTYGSGKEPSKSSLDARDHIKVENRNTSVITSKVPPNLSSFTRDNLPVYHEVNADKKQQPASITKLMTGIITLDYFDNVDVEFTLISSDIKRGSGSDYQAGDRISIYDAIHCLMMESSNTMAEALSRVVGKRIIIENESL